MTKERINELELKALSIIPKEIIATYLYGKDRGEYENLIKVKR